jgi:L-alanine-DL-glutamate epimerase-like enolase superfamily enzyme
MELHASLACGVPNGQWVEYIPQLEGITRSGLRVQNGYAYPSDEPGLGIDWDWDAIVDQQLAEYWSVVT